MGVAPHLLYQAAHKGHARLIGGWPPISFGWDVVSPLSSPYLHAVRWGRTLLGGSPWDDCGVWGYPPPLHAVRWERTLLGGCPLLLFLLVWGVPLLLLRHAIRWERTLPYRGVPPFVRAQPARRRHARFVPCPLLPTRSLRALLGLGAPSLSWALSHGGSRTGVIGGPSPCPRCAPWARAAGWGFPLPLPPLGGRSR